MSEPEKGVIAVSRAGHDKGRAFIIIGRADTEHVYLVDGTSRKLEHPKKKKLRHLHVESHVAETVRDLLDGNVGPTDADIRKALAAFGYNIQQGK